MEHLSAILNLGQRAFQLTLAETGRVRCEPGWQLGPDWAGRLHDFDLWFIWQGVGRLVTSDGVVDLRPGVCVWMRPGRRYEAQQQIEHPLGVNFIHFELAPEASKKKTAFAAPFEVMETRHVDFVDALMRRVIELCGEGESDTAVHLFNGLLRELVREQAAVFRSPVSGLERHHLETIHRVANRVRESPGQVASVAALAKEAGYSIDHFSRVFFSVMGRRPQQFVIEAKMERARQLLGEADFTVGEVATALGFENRHFFSRQFLQHNACTPSEYRTKLARK